MAQSERMQAVVLGEDGPEFQDVDRPQPGNNDILVRVHACGLNRADLLLATGHMHGSVGGVGTRLGMEWSGDVVACGDAVPDFAPGDRVMCAGAGGWAQFAIADWRRCQKIPDSNMSYQQAASLPVALNTMHDAIVTNGGLAQGESILIQGASSGVGIMGLKIAREMGAGLIVGSSTNAERRQRLKDVGADLVIDSRDEKWVDEVLAATDGKGVDLIVDQISGYAANQNLAATAIKGRIVNVGRLGGFSGAFNFDLHAMRRISYIGVTFRTRTIEEVQTINKRMRADLWPALEAGRLEMPHDRDFPFAEITQALAHMGENRHFGKITVSLSG
jgi:NADPH2:quinone reductase